MGRACPQAKGHSDRRQAAVAPEPVLRFGPSSGGRRFVFNCKTVVRETNVEELITVPVDNHGDLVFAHFSLIDSSHRFNQVANNSVSIMHVELSDID